MSLKKIGWIGTGLMGKHMCKHVMNNGYNMSVYNRTASKASDLISSGATWLQPSDLAQHVDVLHMCLGTPQDVERMTLSSEFGLLQHMRPGSYLVDHTTSEPGLAVVIAAEAAKLGIHSIDAPVTGGDVGARNGTLVTMCGGQPEHVETVRPILDSFSNVVEHMGGAGAGQHTKATNQIMVASQMVAVTEGIVYAYKAGLDVEKVLSMLNKGAAGCFALETYAPRALKRDFEPGFAVEHAIKDYGICLAEARKMNLVLPGISLAHMLFLSMAAQGNEKMGIQGLLTALERINNIKVE